MPEIEPICVGVGIAFIPIALLGVKRLIRSIKETKDITTESVDRLHDMFSQTGSIEWKSTNIQQVTKRFLVVNRLKIKVNLNSKIQMQHNYTIVTN